jgi:hypothetical protein|tara:strand:+ start:2942 stop:3589 length:648 start_codon:yes stop_codon:yes gene_type:complete
MKKGWNDIELKKLVKANWNYKEENEGQTEKLINNFKRNGQVENLLIRELDTGFYEVVNGNHRLDVMKILKLKKAHVYNFGKMTLGEAQRIAIETNETKFESDSIKLAELITTLAKEFPIDDLVNTMPYSKDEITNMSDLVNFDFNEFGNTEGVDTFGDDDFSHEVKLKVSQETFERWKDLKERMEKILGYDNESKVFEFAIIEALNIPEECLGVS